MDPANWAARSETNHDGDSCLGSRRMASGLTRAGGRCNWWPTTRQSACISAGVEASA